MDPFSSSYWEEDELLADTGAIFDYHYDADYQNFHDPTCPVPEGPLDQCFYCSLVGRSAARYDTARPQRNTTYGLQDEPQQTWEDIVAAASPPEPTDTATHHISHRLVEQLQYPLGQFGPSQARAATVSHLDPQLQGRNTSAQQSHGAPSGQFLPARGAHLHHGEAGSVQGNGSRSAQTNFAHHWSHPLSAHTAQEYRQDSTSSAEQSTPFRHFRHDSVVAICHRPGFSRLSEEYLQYRTIDDQRHDTPDSIAHSSSQDEIGRLYEHHLADRAHDPHGVSRLADGIAVAHRHDTPMTDDAKELVVPPPAVSLTPPTASALSTTSSNGPAQRPRRTGRQLLHGAFKCSKCACRFDRKERMRAHQHRVHMEHSVRPYACAAGDCDKRFVYYKDLLRHQKLHRPHQPVSCPHCKRKWVVFRADNFRRHMQTKHADHLAVTTGGPDVAMSRQASQVSSSIEYRASTRASSFGGDSEDDPLEDLQRVAAQSLEPT